MACPLTAWRAARLAKHHPRDATSLVILASRWIGKCFLNDDIVAKLRRNLSSAGRMALLDDRVCAPSLIADIFRRVAADSPVSHS